MKSRLRWRRGARGLGIGAFWMAGVLASGPALAQDDLEPWSGESLADDVQSIDAAELLSGESLEPVDLREPREGLDRARGESTPPDVASTAIATPVGGSRSAATPQALPLPDGEGSIQGMGESFSASLSSGALSFTLPLAIPAGRNAVTPSLALGYSSGGGSSEVGYGWALGVAAIARQTDRGLPRYDDRALWHSGEDRFVYAGSAELVPVDSAAMTSLDGGTVPAELAGWQQYRAQVEGGFMRFFRAPDSTRWVVQAPDGTRHDLGQLPASEGPAWMTARSARSLVSSPDGSRVASWALVRTTDPHGSTIHYVYDTHEGERYLSEVYYVSPSSCATGGAEARRRCAASFDDYAVRVRFVYEVRPDATTSYRSGWQIRSARRLRRVEVTAAGEAAGARRLVRRYHFAYSTSSYHSLLASITVEGRPQSLDPSTGAMVGSSVAEAMLSDAIAGVTLPPMRFRYTGEDARARGPDGFPAIDGTRRRGDTSPRDGAGDPRADLFDVNSDGLVDLVVTDPARFRTADGSPAAGVYFNGFAGTDARPGKAGTFSEPIAVAVPVALAGSMQLDNPNLAPMDVDGDGRSDLLHMPRAREYGYFAPVRAPGNAASPASQDWRFVHFDVALDEGLDPRIDLARDGDRIRVLDVNADGLVDVLRTSGDAMQTWLNLGWHVGGEGRFGSVIEGVVTTDPIESCLPSSGAPVAFDDPEVRLADMNGDGLEDIVRLSPGSVVWWPSLGYGRFGEECAPGPARASPIVAAAPADLGVAFDTTYLADLDGDGASDLVQVGGDAVVVWFNMGGVAFSGRSTAAGLPWRRDLDRVVRFADVDGSGTTDVLFARARGWEWIDPMDGVRNRLLERVDNGLGAQTRFEYGASSSDYLRDLAAAASCTGSECETFFWQGRDDGQCDDRATVSAGACVVRSTGAPSVSTVVRATETRDRFEVLGAASQITRVEYAYHDAYYEGIEQEHRGFGATDVRSVGGDGEGTSITRSFMHQGRRPRSIESERLAQSPWEALKGLTFLTETWDEESGAYLEVVHTTNRIHRLAIGLDGREIAWAFSARTDRVVYDHTSYAPATGVVPFYGPGGGDVYPAVERYLVSAGALVGDAEAPGWSEPLRLRSTGPHAVIASTIDRVDHAGHVLQATAWGRVRGEWGEPLPAEEIVSHSTTVLLDAAAWIWRPTESYTTGHGSAERLGWTSLEYASGTVDPVRSIARVAIPRAYAFAGDSDGSQAFTQVAEDMVTSTAYDAWGNATAVCTGASTPSPASACLRHSAIERDAAYAHVVVRETVATDASGGALVWSASFDRGLGVYLRAVDPRGAATEYGYDGVGRPTFVRAPNVRGCEGTTMPLSRVTYALTSDPELVPVSVIETTTFLDCRDDTDVLVSRAYVDGLARERASLSTAEAPHAWVRSGLVEYTARGMARRTRNASFVDALDPAPTEVLAPGAEAIAENGYDAFGRVRYSQALGAVSAERTWTSYGALAVYTCDPLDLLPEGSHVAAGTCSIVRSDGHGRSHDTIVQQRRAIGEPIEVHRLWPTYRADGGLVALERVTTADRAPRTLATPTASVARTFELDSQGRRLASTDRDTDARRASGTVANRSWRYLYNRAGDLVAVRDPRNCGSNYYYDRAGRPIGEDYVTCSEAEPSRDARTESVPAGTIALAPLAAARTVEVRAYFDGYPGWATGDLAPPGWAAAATGLPTATSDRGARSVVAYDERGLASFTARQVVLLPEGPIAPASIGSALPVVVASPIPTRPPRAFDEEHTYATSASFDHAGRATASELPIDPDFGVFPPSVGGAIEYDRRGLPRSVSIDIDGDVYPILASATYAADGAMEELVLGDDRGGTRTPTRTTTEYDARRRPVRMTTARSPTGTGIDRPLSAVIVVADQELSIDLAGNVIAIDDRRPSSEWPLGFRPRSVSLAHDALYRVIGAEYSYAGDAGITDAATDYRDALAALELADPMRVDPAPSVATAATDRVMSLAWDFDFLGNTTEWTDDAHAFHERSLDRITNGGEETDGRPSAIRVASSLPSSPHAFGSEERGGWLEVDYGDSGNVAAVTVHGRCRDASPARTCVDPGGVLATRRSTLRLNCRCDREQHYQYRLDEQNQIVDARRYDRPGSGAWTLAAHLRYAYDGDHARVVKEVVDPSDSTRYAIWPYGGDFERRGLLRGLGTYDATEGTETSYLVGGARIVWKDSLPGTGLDRDHRITVPITDLLGTTGAVIDLASGELVEASTYYPNGARETLRSSELEDVAPEPMGFTGKEADEEVGLTYFGMRFLLPHLGRWATPDPLHIHAEGGGEAMNNYHYVSGNVFQARDPIGLEDNPLFENKTCSSDDNSSGFPVGRVGTAIPYREPPPWGSRSLGNQTPTGTRVGGYSDGYGGSFVPDGSVIVGANALGSGGTVVTREEQDIEFRRMANENARNSAAGAFFGVLAMWRGGDARAVARATALGGAWGSVSGVVVPGPPPPVPTVVTIDGQLRGRNAFRTSAVASNVARRLTEEENFFYAVENDNGGALVVSTRDIGLQHVIDAVTRHRVPGKPTIVLSGTHGDGGRLGAREPAFYQQDQRSFGNLPNTQVIDIRRLSIEQRRSLMRIDAIVVCAWCRSEATDTVIQSLVTAD